MSLFYSPALLAFAFAVFAFAFPSGLSACLLVLALYQLLIAPQTGVQPLTSQADSLMIMLAGWFCVSYCVAGASVGVASAQGNACKSPGAFAVVSDGQRSSCSIFPGFLQALICTTNVRYEELHAFLPAATTAAFAFIIIAVAAHARGHNAGPLWPCIRSRTIAAWASDPPARANSTSSHLSTGTSVATALFVHTLGNVVVSALWFALGTLRLCPAGVLYTVGPAVELLPFQALVAVPRGPQSLSLSRHYLMRSYAALHIALLYFLGLVPEDHMPQWVSTARGFLAGVLALPVHLV